MRAQARDRAPITQRTKTRDGYLLVPGRVMASDNVQTYLAGELRLKGVDPKKVVRVYRPKAEIDKAAGAFDGLPVTLDHPSRMVDAKLWKAVARGDVRNTRAVAEGLDSDLLVKDDAAIESIEKGERKELSAAYDFELTFAPGTSPHGQAYDAVASDIVPNHVAIVRRGRSRTPDGQPCQVADSDPKQGDSHMRVLVFDAMLLGSATATQLPEMEDGAASAVDTLVRSLASARDAAVAERDAVVQECATRIEAQATDHATKLKAIEDGVPARVEAEAMDRASVLAGAASLGLQLKAEGKDTAALRREVITEASKDAGRKSVMDAMVPDLVKASPEALRLATVALFKMGEPVKGKKDPARAHDALTSALTGTKDKVQAADGCAPTGRDAAMKASSSAWRKSRDKQQGA